MPGQATTIAAMLAETRVPAPKKLAVALDAWEAASPDLDDKIDVYQEALTVTADGVPDLIAALTLQSVTKGAVRTSGVLEQVTNLLDRRVSAEFVNDAVIGRVFDAYGAQFGTAVAVLETAAPRLPSTLELAAAHHGSPDSLAAWAEARDAAATLTAVRKRRTQLADWGVVARGIDRQLDLASRFCTFTGRETIDAIIGAEKVTQFDVWVSLARLPGVGLKWNTLDEQAAIAARFIAEDAAVAKAEAEASQAHGEAVADAWVRGTVLPVQ